MEPVKFRFHSAIGYLYADGWVTFGGMGFHREDITGELRNFLDRLMKIYG